MRLGLITPNYPHDRRVALLPQDIHDFQNDLVVESGFGAHMGVTDDRYKACGCEVASRSEILGHCDAIFSLKLIQPVDYPSLRPGQMVIGWTHPTGSGAEFMRRVAEPLDLRIVDLDNIYPRVFRKGQSAPIPFLPRNFIWWNSYLAGFAATQHALLAYGLMPNAATRAAVLGAGNVSQGAYAAVSRYCCDVRLYYRRTMPEFREAIGSYDVIINGIEADPPDTHIIDRAGLQLTKPGCLLIDAAADAGNAIEGTCYTDIEKPIVEQGGRFFYVVNNAPTLYFRTASEYTSKVMTDAVFRPDVARYHHLFDDMSAENM